jgi:hypothetical protein
VGNLLLRVGFALSIVLAAIGLIAGASDTAARCDARSVAVSSGGTVQCAPAPVSVAPSSAVAGYQAAPSTADRGPLVNPLGSDEAATLVALATAAVFLAVFAILWNYRPRPGGVRASHR